MFTNQHICISSSNKMAKCCSNGEKSKNGPIKTQAQNYISIVKFGIFSWKRKWLLTCALAHTCPLNVFLFFYSPNGNSHESYFGCTLIEFQQQNDTVQMDSCQQYNEFGEFIEHKRHHSECARYEELSRRDFLVFYPSTHTHKHDELLNHKLTTFRRHFHRWIASACIIKLKCPLGDWIEVVENPLLLYNKNQHTHIQRRIVEPALNYTRNVIQITDRTN